MLRRVIIAGLLVLSCPGRAATPLPKEAMPLRDAFESSLSGLDGERAERMKQLAADHEAALRKLRAELEAAGQLRPLIAVHDELIRFSKNRDPSAPDPDSFELSTLQAAHNRRCLQVQYSNDVEVVRLTERYVQALAELRDGLEKAHADEAIKGIDEERDRLLSLARVRGALRTTLTRPPTASEAETAGVVSPTNGLAAGKSRQLRLYRLSNEDVSKVMGYNMSLSLIEDGSKLKVRETDMGMSMTRSEDGPVYYTPRISITARNAEVPPDSQMTIDYYTRTFTDSGYKRETSETMPLPRVARGDTATVEGRGLSLWRSISVTHTGRGPDTRTYAGSELYGMVITMRDSKGEALLIRFTPQLLARDLEGPSP